MSWVTVSLRLLLRTARPSPSPAMDGAGMRIGAILVRSRCCTRHPVAGMAAVRAPNLSPVYVKPDPPSLLWKS